MSRNMGARGLHQMTNAELRALGTDVALEELELRPVAKKRTYKKKAVDGGDIKPPSFQRPPIWDFDEKDTRRQ